MAMVMVVVAALAGAKPSSIPKGLPHPAGNRLPLISRVWKLKVAVVRA